MVVKVLVAKQIPGLKPATDLSVDIGTAASDAGAIRCLAAGLPIEIKGSVDAAGVLKPIEVSVGGAWAPAYPGADGGQSGHKDAAVTSGTVDTVGTVTAVRTGEFDIAVFDLENTSLLSTKLTVRYSNTSDCSGCAKFLRATCQF